MKHHQTATDYARKFFCDKNGRLVLWQRPNLPIVVWALARLLQWPLSGGAEQYVQAVGNGAILFWAALEIVDGSTPFRRVLGCAVLAFVIF